MTFSGSVPLLASEDLGGGNYLAIFDAPAIASRIRPAQFVMVRVREGTDPLLGRPFSVARVGKGPHGPTVDLLYKVTGRGTALLAELRPGSPVGMVGPLGQPFPDPPGGATVFMVAGGIGIAPFPLLSGHLAQSGRRLSLLSGARGAGDLVGRDLFPAGVEISTATDDGSLGHHGFVTELLDRALAALDPEERRAAVSYICGPTPMMAAADAVLARHGAGGHFSVEAFMGCGFGVCLSCVIPVRAPDGTPDGNRRICVDGPTFPAGRVDWAGSVEP